MTPVESVRADLESRGYAVERPGDRTQPPLLATGGDAPGAFTDRPLAVEPVDADPTTLVERAAHAARHDRATLYVPTAEDADAVREVLAAPRFVRDDADGRREFYHVPDRIRLRDGGLACVRADGSLAWREEDPGDLGDGAPPLLLEADGAVQAALGSVEDLTCLGPEAAAFPYRYSRADGAFRVERDGREVGRYPTMRALKADAYRPVPVPLVPAHHLRAGVPPMALAVVDDGVRYERA